MNNDLTVFFDGGCPLCSREIAHYRRLKALESICWIDIIREPSRLDRFDVDPRVALAAFHVWDDSAARMYTGAAAFVRLWSSLPGYRWLARCITKLHLTALLELVYRRFARRHFLKRCREGACSA
ncbi:thiol-disulfide oxidoreductase DCC family protein [Methylolobus aquaticus]